MSQNKFDVAVIGAGPAGAVAAYELAKRGLSVVVLEKQDLPRYKACGGIVTPRIDNILDFPIDPVIERKITRMLITVRLGSPFVREYHRPFIYTVMRDKFDHYLVEEAIKVGATVFPKSPVKGLETVGSGFVISTATAHYHARYVIGADGANGITRKLVDAPPFRRLSVAIEREIRDTHGLLDNWDDTLALDFGYLRSGYAWVFPKASNFSVGVGGPKLLSKEFVPYYDEFLRHYDSKIGNTDAYISVGHHLPIRVTGERIAYPGILLTGDAAGLIDPMTGEGIYFAVRSGQIAAETIADAFTKNATDLSLYESRIDSEIQPELQVAKVLLRLLDSAPSFWVPLLLKKSNMFWNFFCRVFTGEKTYHDIERKFGPPARWLFAAFAEE